MSAVYVALHEALVFGDEGIKLIAAASTILVLRLAAIKWNLSLPVFSVDKNNT